MRRARAPWHQNTTDVAGVHPRNPPVTSETDARGGGRARGAPSRRTRRAARLRDAAMAPSRCSRGAARSRCRRPRRLRRSRRRAPAAVELSPEARAEKIGQAGATPRRRGTGAGGHGPPRRADPVERAAARVDGARCRPSRSTNPWRRAWPTSRAASTRAMPRCARRARATSRTTSRACSSCATRPRSSRRATISRCATRSACCGTSGRRSTRRGRCRRARTSRPIVARLKAVQSLIFPRVQDLREADGWERWANAGVQEALITRLESLREQTDAGRGREAAARRPGRVAQGAGGPAREGPRAVAALQDHRRRTPPALRVVLPAAGRRAGREPPEEGSAVRPGRGAGRVDRLDPDRGDHQGAPGRSGRRLARSRPVTRRPCGSGSARPATGSSRGARTT